MSETTILFRDDRFKSYSYWGEQTDQVKFGTDQPLYVVKNRQ